MSAAPGAGSRPRRDAPRATPGLVVALLGGWGVIAFAVAGLLRERDGATKALEIGAWIAGGHVVHDALVAPVAVLGALVLGRLLPEAASVPVRAGLGATAIVLAVSVPLLGGFGREPGNPSVLPLAYDTAVLTVVAVVWAIVALWFTARVLRGRLRRRAASSTDG